MAARGLRLTAARRQITRVAIDQPSSFCAEALVEHEAGAKEPRGWLASVDRLMPAMIEAGLLRESTFPTPRGRLGVVFERQAADHVRCVDCGSVTPYRVPVLEELERLLRERFGFELLGRRFAGYGHCRACRSSRAPQSA